VWVSDESGLEDELRDGTLDSPEWDMFWSDVDPDLVEQLVADYTSCSVGENGEPHPDVARLRRLFTTGRAEDESERELLWEVWQDYGDG
jgi:hypothetical protein